MYYPKSPSVSVTQQAPSLEQYYSGIGIGTVIILVIATTTLVYILKRRRVQSTAAILVPETGISELCKKENNQKHGYLMSMSVIYYRLILTKFQM